jgi:hypothetical protein
MLTICSQGIVNSAINFSVQTYCCYKRGPILVTMFAPLQTIFATLLSLLFFGDTYCLGRYYPFLQSLPVIFSSRLSLYSAVLRLTESLSFKKPLPWPHLLFVQCARGYFGARRPLYGNMGSSWSQASSTSVFKDDDCTWEPTCCETTGFSQRTFAGVNTFKSTSYVQYCTPLIIHPDRRTAIGTTYNVHGSLDQHFCTMWSRFSTHLHQNICVNPIQDLSIRSWLSGDKEVAKDQV